MACPHGDDPECLDCALHGPYGGAEALVLDLAEVTAAIRRGVPLETLQPWMGCRGLGGARRSPHVTVEDVRQAVDPFDAGHPPPVGQDLEHRLVLSPARQTHTSGVRRT
jgi:hypothetical protein